MIKYYILGVNFFLKILKIAGKMTTFGFSLIPITSHPAALPKNAYRLILTCSFECDMFCDLDSQGKVSRSILEPILELKIF